MLPIQTTIPGRIQQAAQLTLKNWQVFVLFPVIVYVIAGLLLAILASIGVVSLVTTTSIYNPGAIAATVGLGIVITVVINVIASLISAIVPLQASNMVHHDQKPELGSLIQFALKNLGRYISIAWAVFKYVALWPVVGIIAGFVLMAVGIPSLGGLVVSLSMLALAVMMVWRGVQAVFAPYIGICDQKSGSESIATSAQLSNGRWGDIVINVIVYGLVAGIAAAIISAIGGSIASMFGSPFSYTTTRALSYNYFSLYHIVIMLVEAISTGLTTGFITLCVYQYWQSVAHPVATPVATTPVTPPTA
jgi:hypothetical protein